MKQIRSPAFRSVEAEERERCAQIAEQFAETGGKRIGRRIAEAIRGKASDPDSTSPPSGETK